MFDYQEEMDQYLEEIEELARSKQYTERSFRRRE